LGSNEDGSEAIKGPKEDGSGSDEDGSGSDEVGSDAELRVVVFLDLKTLQERARFNLPDSLHIDPSTLKDAALYNDCTMLYMETIDEYNDRTFVFYDIKKKKVIKKISSELYFVKTLVIKRSDDSGEEKEEDESEEDEEGEAEFRLLKCFFKPKSKDVYFMVCQYSEDYENQRIWVIKGNEEIDFEEVLSQNNEEVDKIAVVTIKFADENEFKFGELEYYDITHNDPMTQWYFNFKV
jgi:hypothetical protein